MSEKNLTDVIRQSLSGRQPETKESVFKEILGWLAIVIVACAAAFLLNGFVIVNAQVTSGSMESTIMTGDRVLGFRTSYWFSDPKWGDIVFFRCPDNEEKVYVKRVIGLPGDTIKIEGGVVYRNGEALVEPYLNEVPKVLDFGPYEVPEGYYFMLGDNRNNSSDSRYWTNTYVSKDKILGKAAWIYYPRFVSVEHYSEDQ